MSQSFSGRILKPDGVLFRELGGESVLLNLDTESYFGLDEVGTRMWSALQQTGSVQQAFEVLTAEYDVESGQLRADLSRFVEQLAESGLVELVDA